MNNYKRNLSILLVFTAVGSLSAETLSTGETVLNWIYQNIFFTLAAIVIIGVISSIMSLLWSLIMQQKQAVLKEAGIVEVKTTTNTISMWKKLYNKAWSLIPIDKEADILLHHDFDGIHELDNKLPPWWLYLFFGTIVWGAIYFYMFQYSDNAKSQEEIYNIEMQEAKEAKRLYASKQANAVDEYNVISLEDEASIASGRKAFITNCSACHGQLGEGSVGPNLTDEYWLHGGSTVDIFKTIKYGVPEKGMQEWKSRLNPSTIQKLTSFIETLQGTNPPNPKAKQGIRYQAENIDQGNVSDTEKTKDLSMLIEK
jgi:cytochrome c oxidase cbb3-type subunit 3